MLCVSLMGNGKHQQLQAFKCILSLSLLYFLNTLLSYLENNHNLDLYVLAG